MGNKFCTCHDSEKHGQTSVMCCNKCGLPDEEFWHNPAPSNDYWKKVEDGLPEYDETVIVYGQRKLSQPVMGGNPDIVTIGSRIEIKGSGLEKQRDRYVDKNEFRQMNYVTHWQYLPKPPSEQLK